MFNISEKFKVMTRAGALEIDYVSDSHWDARAKAHPRRQKITGRNEVEPEYVSTAAFDARLFREIAGADAPGIKEREMTAIITALDRCDVVEVEMDGDNFRLTAEVFGYSDFETREQERTTCTLREPTQAEMEDFVKRSTRVEVKGKVITNLIYLKVFGELFDKLLVSPSESYVGNKVPLNHKAAFVGKLVSEVNDAVDVQAVDPGA